MLRKLVSLVTVFAVLFVLSSCKDTVVDETTDAFAQVETTTAEDIQTQETTTEAATEAQTTTEIQTTAPVTETTTVTQETTATETTTQVIETTEAPTQAPPVTEVQTTEAVTEDVSSWDVQKVVEFYKNAAQRTGTSVKSQQTVELKDISVNNGQLGGMFSFVTPILSSFLSSSVTETDGITGDFSLLTAADVSSAKAYEAENGTAVEITLNSQTDSAASQTRDGSVAHGISVVGDLPSIMSQLKEKGLPIDISLENTVLTYTNPVIKVLIDDNSNIVKGTWSCTVEISLSDYKFAGSAVDSTVVVLNNKIVVNGGFNP
ncbi:MAG: hypothetical protein IKJ88_08415 [Clostridia bacterium]|nr:hypothetical protein [Clostridia bacterium]MBR3975868.1 hypothetical protein [Clostridia bacterium]